MPGLVFLLHTCPLVQGQQLFEHFTADADRCMVVVGPQDGQDQQTENIEAVESRLVSCRGSKVHALQPSWPATARQATIVVGICLSYHCWVLLGVKRTSSLQGLQLPNTHA